MMLSQTKRSHRMNQVIEKSTATIRIQDQLTNHAWERMTARTLNLEAVEAVFDYGRLVHVRGAEVYAIGRREVDFYAKMGIDLQLFEGIQVVCSPDGAILTVYRNRNFRGLRPGAHGHRSVA